MDIPSPFDKVTKGSVVTLESPITDLRYEKLFDCILLSTEDGKVCVHDLTEKIEPVKFQTGSTKPMTSLCYGFYNRGHYVIAGSEDCSIRIIKLGETPVEVSVLQDHTGPVRSVVSITRRIFATSGDDSKIFIYDLKSLKKYFTLEDHTEGVNSLLYLRSKELLFSAGGVKKDLYIRCWDWKNGKLVKRFGKGHSKSITCLSYYYDHKKRLRLISGGSDQQVIFWDGDTGEQVRLLRALSPVRSLLVFNSDYLLSGGEDGGILSFEITKSMIQRKWEHGEGTGKLEWVQKREAFISVGKDGYIIWKIEKEEKGDGGDGAGEHGGEGEDEEEMEEEGEELVLPTPCSPVVSKKIPFE